jgi:hypothetical protein
LPSVVSDYAFRDLDITLDVGLYLAYAVFGAGKWGLVELEPGAAVGNVSRRL